jgi:2-keto-3-deoxy-L-rhamnonate aldolase RhmA
VDRILAVPGVAACFVGPTDLASSLDATAGGPAALTGAIERVRAACVTAGKPAGIAARDLNEARAYARQGFRFVAVGTDRRALAAAMAQTVAAWTSQAGAH